MKDDRCEGNTHYGCSCITESRNWPSDIHTMHEKHGAHRVDFDGNFLEFRTRFLEEELREFREAIDSNDPEKAVDALIDLGVIVVGTLDLGGVNIDKAWDEVFKRNMEKNPGENPTRSGSGGFDLVKPPGWIAPNHSGNTGYFDLAIQQLLKKKQVLKEQEEPSENGFPSHIKVMDEWREFSFGKNHDYNDKEDPEFQHAAYYPDGINNIVYELWKKIKRIRRNLKRMYNGGSPPKTESVRDSFRDIHIYSAIGGAYWDGNLEGQSSDRDVFNREK